MFFLFDPLLSVMLLILYRISSTSCVRRMGFHNNIIHFGFLKKKKNRRMNKDLHVIKDIFWLRSNAINLFYAFLTYSLTFDSKYKTNLIQSCKLQLLEVHKPSLGVQVFAFFDLLSWWCKKQNFKVFKQNI